MSLSIGRRPIRAGIILDLSGRLTGGGGVSLFLETVRDLAAEGTTSVILNLTAVDFMDSTGVGAVVVCSELLRNQAGRLTINNAQALVRDVLRITHLDHALRCFDNEDAAIASLAP
jgi:anti-sigma B factor antagonist